MKGVNVHTHYSIYVARKYHQGTHIVDSNTNCARKKKLVYSVDLLKYTN